MAQRYWSQFALWAPKGVVHIFPAVIFEATSAPSLVRWSPNTRTYVAAPSSGGCDGAASFTRTSAGIYVLTLQDTYQRVLSASLTLFDSAATAPLIVAFGVATATDPTLAASAVAHGLGATSNTLTVHVSTATGTLADPAATVLGIFHVVLQNSTAL